MNIHEFTYNGEARTGSLLLQRYRTNNNLCVALRTHSSLAMLSVNVPGVRLESNEFCAKTYSENAGLPFEQFCTMGLLTNTGRRAQVGFVTVPIYMLNVDWEDPTAPPSETQLNTYAAIAFEEDVPTN